MRSRLSSAAAGVGESGILIALALLPGFFDVYSEQSFEFDKAALLRSLAGVILAGLLVHVLEEGRSEGRAAHQIPWRHPLVLTTLVLTGALALAAACSIAPSLSWWGSYQRAQGLDTWASYLVVFVATALLTRSRAQVDRFVVALLLGAVPPAWYAIVQRVGADPINWGLDSVQRTPSTAGNAIFLGSVLIMTLPFALGRAAYALTPAPEVTAGAWHRLGRASPYLALALLYGLGLLGSNSRGPMVGAGIAMLVLAALTAIISGRRRPLFATLGLAVAGGAALLWVHLAGNPSRAPDSPRIAQMLDLQEGTGRVRVLLWESAGRLITAEARHTVVGYGPETALLAFQRVYPPELAVLEQHDVSPDRAHNAVLDASVSGGVLLATADLAVFLAFVGTCLRHLGLLRGTRSAALFAAASVIGAIAGGLGPSLRTGNWYLAPIGAALGLVGGMTAYMVGAGLRRRPARPAPMPEAFVIAAACAAACAHFAETQVGLATTVPRLYFFASAGLIVAMTMRPDTHRAAADRPERQAAIIGTLVALLLITLQFDLRTSSVNLAVHGRTLGSGLLLLWLTGAALLGDTTSVAGAARWRTAATYAGGSVTLWLAFAVIHGRWALWMPPSGLGVETSVRVFGTHLGHIVAVYYGAVGLGVAVLAAVLAHRAERDVPWRVRTAALVTGGVLLGASVALALANLRTVQADCLAKLGKSYEGRGLWREAITAHAAAVEAAPAREEYAVNLSRALIERAQRTRDPAERDATAGRAATLAEAMARVSPLNPDHPANVARLVRAWARTGDPAERGARLAWAAAAYARALALNPTNPALWSEAGVLDLERGDLARAHQRFGRAIELEPRYIPPYALRAQAALAAGDEVAASADLRRARQLVAGDPPTQAKLIRLYQRIALVDHALAEARAAAATDAPATHGQTEAFITALDAARTTAPPPR